MGDCRPSLRTESMAVETIRGSVCQVGGMIDHLQGRAAVAQTSYLSGRCKRGREVKMDMHDPDEGPDFIRQYRMGVRTE